ncbi:hypothetical protein CCUG60885_02187 [Mycobacteroides salmoniphilum]|uniref:Uncharacterized protein n=1 Tax=Mycobacteroides salmoniphilum TaxID=404941 RepID=A0A4R8SGV7_9MYCO|nr:hypothetical protein CCUG60885_02187 [Mycobacteroides salmoniphilum]TEA05146.1 hypothetical protein CCUG60883_02446 [Mycobacteroides salmoniphilum]
MMSGKTERIDYSRLSTAPPAEGAPLGTTKGGTIDVL